MTNSTHKRSQILKITVSYELSLKKWRRSAPLNDANGKINLRAESRIRFRPAQTRVSRAIRTCPVLDGSFPCEKIQRLRPFPLARHRRRSPRPHRLLHRRGRIPTAWTSDRPRSRWWHSGAHRFSRDRRRPSDLRRRCEDGRGHEHEQEEEGGYAPHPDSDDDAPTPAPPAAPAPAKPKRVSHTKS
jgi:hypothetical protein